MKTILIFLLGLISVPTMAKTQVQFFGIEGMINIVTPTTGTTDQDAQTLYDKMNVPPKDSRLGPGKAIKTPNKELNFVCSNSKARGYICTMVLNRSSHTVLTAHKMTYEVSDAAAFDLWQKFYPDSNQEVHYVTEDHLFRIDATQTHFVLSYDAAGRP